MITKKIKDTIRKYSLLDKNDKVIIGVSGGPDSVTLLYALNYLKKELNLTLHIVHIDHKIRKDSSRDKKFVLRLAKKINCPVTAEEIDIKKLAKKGSIEEIARNTRLAIFFKVAEKIKADKIALGHNLDDQAETVLMRLLRGTGLSGLSGILPKRSFGKFSIIRPLINIRRREIESFLKRRKLCACKDSTNAEDIYFRNKIRNKLIPLLEKNYNRNIKEILSNTAENIGQDYDYLNTLAVQTINKLSRKIRLSTINKYHPSLRRMILRLNIARLKGDTRRITFKHVKELEDLIANRPNNSIVDLPANIAAIKKKNTLYFYRKKT